MRTRRMGSVMAIAVLLAGVGMVSAGVLMKVHDRVNGCRCAAAESHVDRVFTQAYNAGRHGCWLPIVAALMA